MTSIRSDRVLTAIALLLSTSSVVAAGQDAAKNDRDLPAALAPLEYVVGRWKGQGVPRDNPAQRFRGWTETHTWAWVFTTGKPTGLSLTIEGGKFLRQGTLTFDATEKSYRLEGKGSGTAGSPVVLVGKLDSTGKLLTLESSAGSTRERLSIRANSNYVRYTMILDRKPPGGVAFAPVIEVGLTKEGESFAAGSATVDRPKCIVTGGAATLSVSYQGQNYPICCTGCRDEFNENPAKYIKKLSLRTTTGSASKSDAPKTSRVSRFEDAFAGDVTGSEAKLPERPAAGASNPRKPAVQKDEASANPSTSERPVEKAKPADKSSTRAATALRMAQNLEKTGKDSAALKSYKQIVKDYPGTPAAKTATARIKAIEGQ